MIQCCGHVVSWLRRNLIPELLLFSGCILSVLVGAAWSQDSPRETPTVRLIEKVGSAVVPIFTQTGPSSGGAGSGAVIHRSGFILTADHVTKNYPGVVLFGLERVPYEVVGRSPEKDLAILKVDPKLVRAELLLARSDDLKAGEPIIVGGNPSGRGTVFAQGTINTPSVEPSWPNILVKSFWRKDDQDAEMRQIRSTGGRPNFIQFDASSNPGNSGGPLINAEGDLIGVVAVKSLSEQGINWAIPVDRIRLLMPLLIQPEVTGEFDVGLEVDMLANDALVTRVDESSAAHEAGIRIGDRLVSLDNETLRGPVDWLILLHGHKPNDRLNVTYERANATTTCEIVLRDFKHFDVASEAGKAPGLAYRFFKGRFNRMPDFGNLKPVSTGQVEEIAAEKIVDARQKEYGIVFEGYIEFPEAGLYVLALGSDDSSRVFLGNRLVVDNDLPHPYQKLSRVIRVPKGLIPFRLEYAEISGEKALTFEVKSSHESEAKVPVKYFRDGP